MSEAPAGFVIGTLDLFSGEIGLLDHEVDHLVDPDVGADLAAALPLVQHRTHRVHRDLVHAWVVHRGRVLRDQG